MLEMWKSVFCNRTEQTIQTTVRNKIHNIKQSLPFTSIHVQQLQSLSQRGGGTHRAGTGQQGHTRWRGHGDKGRTPAPSWTRVADTHTLGHASRSREEGHPHATAYVWFFSAGHLSVATHEGHFTRLPLPTCYIPVIFQQPYVTAVFGVFCIFCQFSSFKNEWMKGHPVLWF